MWTIAGWWDHAVMLETWALTYPDKSTIFSGSFFADFCHYHHQLADLSWHRRRASCWFSWTLWWLEMLAYQEVGTDGTNILLKLKTTYWNLLFKKNIFFGFKNTFQIECTTITQHKRCSLNQLWLPADRRPPSADCHFQWKEEKGIGAEKRPAQTEPNPHVSWIWLL